MTTSERIQRLFSSPVFMFLFCGFFFGVFMQLSTTHKHPFSWPLVAITGIPFGLIMTVITSQRMKKFKELAGITDQNQARTLRAAFKAGKLPSDPKDLEALPIYLHKISKMYGKAPKRGVGILIAILVINLLTSLGSHNMFQIIISLVILPVIVGSYFSIQRATARLDNLYRQLGLKPEVPTTSWPSPSEVVKKVARVLFEFGSGYLGLIITLTGVGLCFVIPEVAFNLGVPLIVVGILFLAPYYLLRKRWAAIYAIVLPLAVTIAIYRLHMPVGPKMHVPAHMSTPHAHSLLGYSGWAVFHSTFVLVAVGALILLDMAIHKSRNARRDKSEWFKTIAIVVAIATLTLPLRFNFNTQQQTPPSQTVTSEPSTHNGCVPASGTLSICPTNDPGTPPPGTDDIPPGSGLPAEPTQGFYSAEPIVPHVDGTAKP